MALCGDPGKLKARRKSQRCLKKERLQEKRGKWPSTWLVVEATMKTSVPASVSPIVAPLPREAE